MSSPHVSEDVDQGKRVGSDDDEGEGEEEEEEDDNDEFMGAGAAAGPYVESSVKNANDLATLSRIQLSDYTANYEKIKELFDASQRFLQERNANPNAPGRDRNNTDPIGLQNSYQAEGVKFIHSREMGDVKGGILGDDMGMGKTFQMLVALLGCRQLELENRAKLKPKLGPKAKLGPKPEPDTKPKPTLIILQNNTVGQWVKALKHTANIDATVLTSNADMECPIKVYNTHDVFITTYTYMQTYGKRCNKYKDDMVKTGKTGKTGKKPKMPLCGLLDVDWERVVLDEAHMIKNYLSLTSRVVWALKTKIKWCLTGTYIQNEITELHSLFSWIGVQESRDFLNMTNQGAVVLSDGTGSLFTEEGSNITTIRGRRSSKPVDEQVKALQTMQNKYLLRRTLDEAILNNVTALPKLTTHIVEIDFETRKEKLMYQKIILAYLKKSRSSCDATYMLAYIDYCRMCCTSPEVTEWYIKRNQTKKAKRQLKLKQLQDNKIRETTLNKRSSSSTTKRARSCDDGDDDEDFFGDVEMRSSAEAAAATAADADYDFDDDFPSVFTSSKMKKVMDLLTEVHPEEKFVIFCKWSGMIKMVDRMLKVNNIKATTYVGSISVKQREMAIDNFFNGDTRGLIVQSLIGCTGLNLQAASVVISLNPDWNPSMEMQAIKRVHRAGQKREVTVYRLHIKGTFEVYCEYVMCRKTLIIKGVMNDAFIESRLGFHKDDVYKMLIERLSLANSSYNEIMDGLWKNHVKYFRIHLAEVLKRMGVDYDISDDEEEEQQQGDDNGDKVQEDLQKFFIVPDIVSMDDDEERELLSWDIEAYAKEAKHQQNVHDNGESRRFADGFMQEMESKENDTSLMSVMTRFHASAAAAISRQGRPLPIIYNISVIENWKLSVECMRRINAASSSTDATKVVVKAAQTATPPKLFVSAFEEYMQYNSNKKRQAPPPHWGGGDASEPARKMQAVVDDATAYDKVPTSARTSHKKKPVVVEPVAAAPAFGESAAAPVFGDGAMVGPFAAPVFGEGVVVGQVAAPIAFGNGAVVDPAAAFGAVDDIIHDRLNAPLNAVVDDATAYDEGVRTSHKKKPVVVEPVAAAPAFGEGVVVGQVAAPIAFGNGAVVDPAAAFGAVDDIIHDRLNAVVDDATAYDEVPTSARTSHKKKPVVVEPVAAAPAFGESAAAPIAFGNGAIVDPAAAFGAVDDIIHDILNAPRSPYNPFFPM